MLSSGVYSIDPFYPVRFSIAKYGVVSSAFARCLLDRVPGMTFALCLLTSAANADAPQLIAVGFTANGNRVSHEGETR